MDFRKQEWISGKRVGNPPFSSVFPAYQVFSRKSEWISGFQSGFLVPQSGFQAFRVFFLGAPTDGFLQLYVFAFLQIAVNARTFSTYEYHTMVITDLAL